MAIETISTVLGLLGKAGITFAGREITKTFWEDIKDKIGLNKTNAERLGNAFFNASMKSKETEESIGELIVSFEEDEYYKLLLLGVGEIDKNKELTPYLKWQSKLFLIEIFKDEQLRAYFFNEKLDLLFQKTSIIQGNLLEILSLLKTQQPQKISNFPINKFIGSIENFPEYYILRSLSPSVNFYSVIYNWESMLEHREDKSKSLRVIILADGGAGKSTLLKYWASNTTALYPVFISLRDYVSSDSFEEYIYRRYTELRIIGKSEYSNICFFIDGFDEVQDISTTIRRINEFCNIYKDSHIIITSRSNAYSGELERFERYYLNDIEKYDVERYITSIYSDIRIDFSNFWSEISKNDFLNMVFSPFYLDILIKSYIDNRHSLNISKRILVDKILKERKLKDKDKRPDWKINNPREKQLISQKRKEIAFIMALMNQRYLLEVNLLDILGNEKDLDFYIGTMPIKKGQSYEKSAIWEFEHNIFLEHIVASRLIDLEVDKIIEIATTNSKIKPSWADIITHLLGILDCNDSKEKVLFDKLVSWIRENDGGILMKVESAQLPQEIRNDIFWKTFQWYQEKRIWIDSYGVKREQWAKFSENKENIYKVFNEIVNKEKTIQNRKNAALLFGSYKFHDLTEEEKDTLAKEYIENLKEIPLLHEDLIYDLIYTFPFSSEKYLGDIIEQFGSSISTTIRNGVYHIIHKNQLQDKYIDLLLDAILFNQRKGFSSSHNIESLIKLNLTSLKDTISYVKLFKFLYKNEDVYYSFREQGMDSTLMEVLTNSMSYYSLELLDIILELSSKHESWGGGRWENFVNFFNEEHIRLEAIDRLLNKYLVKGCNEHDFYNYTCTLASIINEHDFDKITKKIDSISFYEILYKYYWKGTILSKRIEQHLIDKYGYTIPSPSIDIWAERRNVEFDILFDKEYFKNECLNIFSILNTEIINPKQLLVDNHKREEEKVNHWNLTVIQILRKKFGDRDISKDELSNWLYDNDKELEDYLQSYIFSVVKNKKERFTRLTQKQISYIIDWYNRRINEVDFEVRFKKNTDGGFSKEKYDDRIPILLFYAYNLNLDISDNSLCKQITNPLIINQHNQLTFPDENGININMIAEKVNNKAILEKTLKSILEDADNQFDTILNIVSIYAIEHHLDNLYPLIINILKNQHSSNKHIIEAWLKHGLPIQTLLSIKDKLSHIEQIFLADQLILQNKNINEVQEILRVIPLDSSQEAIYLEILILRIKCKDLEALKLFIKHCKERQFIGLEKYPERDIMAMLKYQDNYLRYDNIEAFPVLMEYLELCYTIGQVEFVPHIVENIKNLALQNEENYNVIIKQLNNYVKNSKSPYLEIQNLHYSIESIKQSYLEKQSNEFDYWKAKKIYIELYNY